MSYFMRFIQTDPETTSLQMLEQALKQEDSLYSVVDIAGVGTLP